MQPITQLFFLAAVAAVGLAASDPTDNWSSFHVRWSAAGAKSYAQGTGYYTLPLTQQNAEKEGWVQAASDDITTTWCKPNDPRVCVLYDNQGSIAGLNVGVPAADADFEGSPYPVAKHALFNQMTLFGQKVYAGRYYIVDQDTLKAGGRTSPTKLGNGLWLQKGAELVNIPLNGDGLVEDSWTRENCIPGMGRHYYYNVSTETQCPDFQPYFLLTDTITDKVLGLGFQTFGKSSKADTDWFENVPAFAIKPTVPTAPQCLVDWAGQYGIISLHMYFVDQPWAIAC